MRTRLFSPLQLDLGLLLIRGTGIVVEPDQVVPDLSVTILSTEVVQRVPGICMLKHRVAVIRIKIFFVEAQR